MRRDEGRCALHKSRTAKVFVGISVDDAPKRSFTTEGTEKEGKPLMNADERR
jgi:hypothetical protein